ncbi:outer membrane protein assembly factor BamA [Neptuniibacter caesariensis]|uniref:Outer membrane protein assembly factor BamA n=1 Tax=Neptuniibacter caesariensis TaxID=207954 RepID=A0A7U8C7J6_NEPCE|nr:outer membrane protein assembly factor BamA [Neptuniibacter caesariensis]EAR63048.1 probable outer membrane protein [Oceanospirillum sp. MED92] [Neptuniibacter caesariensis]
MKRSIGLLLALVIWSSVAQANNSSFEIQDIRLEGLQRVSPGLVFRNFPITAGDQVSSAALAKATRKLFKTGYFDDVKLSRDNGVLVLKLLERPSVSLIRIEGNDVIETEMLLEGLKQGGLQEGDVFKRATLESIKQDLVRVYASQGRYGASVTTDVETLPGNRVALNIDVAEGQIATIQHINIVGNTVYTDEELKELFSLKLPHFWSFYKKDDRYARQKLSGDLEKLRSYYLDSGYANFSIDSTQVSITPDKKNIFITVNVTEGEKHTIRAVDIAGEMVVPENQLMETVRVEEGQTFSRKLIVESQDALATTIGNAGYMFANISPVPEVHDDNTVTVKFFLDPGKRTYVRRINISGNTRTADDVIRQHLKQMESAVASNEMIEQSKVRLEKTGYFKSVNVETTSVPGSDDLVDVSYVVEEQQSGSFSASLGFSQNSGIILGFNLQQDNFLGTGKKVGVGISNSDTLTEYSYSYVDPYYTVDGVSRGFSLYYRERDFDEDNTSAFSTDEIGGGVNFGYPIDDYQRLNFGLNLEQVSINTNATETPAEINQYIADEGNDYFNMILRSTWTDNHLNRGFFPTKGYSHTASLELGLPGSDLSYYKASFNTKYYRPLDDNRNWVLSLRGRFGYGGELGGNEYPFYKHFFAGGLKTVRGFEQNSLGPRDSKNDPFGGDVLITGGAEFIFPTPFVKDQSGWRTLLFVDAGNVFDTQCSSASIAGNCEEGIKLDELRYSAGFGLSWLTPIGPLSFAIAAPLNDKSGDETEVFQFALGQTF